MKSEKQIKAEIDKSEQQILDWHIEIKTLSKELTGYDGDDLLKPYWVTFKRNRIQTLEKSIEQLKHQIIVAEWVLKDEPDTPKKEEMKVLHTGRCNYLPFLNSFNH